MTRSSLTLLALTLGLILSSGAASAQDVTDDFPPLDKIPKALPVDAPEQPAANPKSKPKAEPTPEKKATSALEGGVEKGEPARSIVRVNVSHQAHSFRIPWQKGSPGSRRGLGAVLPGEKILVTAELVANATYLEFEMADSGRKVTAVVDVIDYEANLALLRPEKPAPDFFKDLLPLRLAEDTAIGDVFEVWQFETNGSPSVTPTEVKKAEVGPVFLPNHGFLVYRASGNVVYLSGSFTLPVARDGQLAGLLLRYSSKDQVSTILPAPIIRHFLEDAADGDYQGFPSLGIKFTQTIDEQFRDYLGLKDREGGVYVSGVQEGGSAKVAGLEEGDILLELGGFAVDPRGNYIDPKYGLLSLGNLIKGTPQVGDEIELKILRDGQEKTLVTKLVRRKPEDHLVIPYMFDRGPRYLVMGGLLFEELTQSYLKSFGEKWETSAPFKLVYASGHPESFRKDGRDRVIFLAGVIPSVSVQGYERLGGLILDTVNGRKIGNIKDLDAAFKKPKDGLHEIRFHDYPKVIWLDDELARKDNMIFLPQRYRITELQRLD